MFVKQVEVGRFAVFAYLVGSETTGDALVIDPAADGELLVKEAEKNKLRINYIVNTHSHIDHVMGNKKMKELTGARIVIHEAEAPYLSNQAAHLMQMFGAEPSPPADITVREERPGHRRRCFPEGDPYARPLSGGHLPVYRRSRLHG